MITLINHCCHDIFRLQDQMPTSTNAIYQAAARLWKPWLHQEALTTLSRGEEALQDAVPNLAGPRHPLTSVSAGGFYSQRVKPGLRLVSLNTILYYSPDKATRNMTDPAGQFKWLQKTLEKSAQNQEKVCRHDTMLVVWWCLIFTQLMLLTLSVHPRCTSSATCRWATCLSPGTSAP